MPLYFYDKEIPASLVRKIIGLSLTRVGIYDGTHHKFVPRGFAPDRRTYETVQSEAISYGFQSDDTHELVSHVLSAVGTETVSQFVSVLDLAGDNELSPLTHVRFNEVNNGITELLYIGAQRFYVLSTNRSTLMPGNIIKAREIPLNLRTQWQFDIYEDFSSSAPSVPEGYKKYQAWFQTTEVTDITLYSSPDFFKIIDDEDVFGGRLRRTPVRVAPPLASLINKIKNVVNGLGKDSLSFNQQFPEYDTLLELAKGNGINTYTLNTLIQILEKRDVKDYVFTEEDWHVYKTKEQIEEERREEDARNKERYAELISKVKKELAQIRRRKVALFFDADGVITVEGRKHIDYLRDELECLAEKGYGTKGDVDSQIKAALDNSKKRPRHNLKVTLWMIATVIVALFVAYSWMTAASSMQKFNEDSVVLQEMLESEQLDSAKVFIEQSEEAFRPSYLRFIVLRQTHIRENNLEKSIDDFVTMRVAQIETLIRANRGRIDEYTWGLITEAMEYRPEDSRLQELRDQYIRQ